MTLVDRIVNAVLYEGYALYPYRASSAKNQQRFTFGRVYPEAYGKVSSEPSSMQTECIVIGSDATKITVSVRFLHVMNREVEQATSETFVSVAELQVDDQCFETWQEASEQRVVIEPTCLHGLAQHIPFDFLGFNETTALRNRTGVTIGRITRRRAALEGTIELTVSELADGIYKLTVRIHNETPMRRETLTNQNAVLLHTLASTHTISTLTGGAFISMTDPPDEFRQMVAECRNQGTWPVLVGEQGQRDTLLSSPIILYDYPQIAPESPGELFDAAEIDEILTLRVMTLTDEEKQSMADLDERTAEILRRTSALTEEQLLNLHGTLREPTLPDGRQPLTAILVGDKQYQTGSRVRLRPDKNADIMDIVLAGCTGVIEAIEQDYEQRVYLAVVLDDDPGKEFGMMRQVAHRFFYAPEEVELLEDAP